MARSTGRRRPRRERDLRTVNYHVEDRPQVEVQHDDGRWYLGWLHAWVPGEAPGTWYAVVDYHTAPHLHYYRAEPVEKIRRVPIGGHPAP